MNEVTFEEYLQTATEIASAMNDNVYLGVHPEGTVSATCGGVKVTGFGLEVIEDLRNKVGVYFLDIETKANRMLVDAQKSLKTLRFK